VLSTQAVSKAKPSNRIARAEEDTSATSSKRNKAARLLDEMLARCAPDPRNRTVREADVMDATLEG
jgi:hypothetical protein